MLLQAGSLSAQEKIPALLPPQGEMEPVYWEQHGWQLSLAGIGGLIFLALAICFLRRSKPLVMEAPDVLSRKLLKRLSGRTQDGALISEVSRITRMYILSALCLPTEECTTTEFCALLASQRQIDAELIKEIAAFQKLCDELKFSPVPPVAPFDAISRALKLIDEVELNRRQIVQRDDEARLLLHSR